MKKLFLDIVSVVSFDHLLVLERERERVKERWLLPFTEQTSDFPPKFKLEIALAPFWRTCELTLNPTFRVETR
jgi:hypothetical protein